MKRTGWFMGNVKPVHVGVYERKKYGLVEHSLWDGNRWLLGWGESKSVALDQQKPWRGLAERPK